MMNHRALLDKLRYTRQKFEAAARQIPNHYWRTPPREGARSAAEVVAHSMVETLMTGAAARITRKPPLPLPLWKRTHIPVALVSWCFVRVESPIPLDTLLLDERETMLSRLVEQRPRTLAVLEFGRDSNLRKYRVQHPLLGSLHHYDWFRTLAAHDTRSS
jgi:DinB superfamily